MDPLDVPVRLAPRVNKDPLDTTVHLGHPVIQVFAVCRDLWVPPARRVTLVMPALRVLSDLRAKPAQLEPLALRVKEAYLDLQAAVETLELQVHLAQEDRLGILDRRATLVRRETMVQKVFPEIPARWDRKVSRVTAVRVARSAPGVQWVNQA